MKYPKTKVVLVLFTIGLFYFLACSDEEEQEEAIFVSEILGEKETCMQCHTGVTGFAPSHDPAVIGCAPCHLGDPRSMDTTIAHRGMVLVPGNLSDVRKTCGTANCHADITPRVASSLMTTMAGIITVNRFVFGESDTLDAHVHVTDLASDTPADTHLRNLCASCHLGKEKTVPGPVTERTRGGGCNACHLQYEDAARVALAELAANPDHPYQDIAHPALTIRVTNQHCFGCHSRSGRISTNYEGWHETTLIPDAIPNDTNYRVLADQRVFEFVQADVHHLQGLECIDCHPSTEVMGDGKRYYHEEDAVKIQCQDCHFEGPPETVSFAGLDPESKKLLQLRNMAAESSEHLIVANTGMGLINTRLIGDTRKPVLIGKNTSDTFELKPPAKICTRGNAHDALSCASCHSGWAPQCLGCHTFYDEDASSIDLLTGEKVQGKWVEHIGTFLAEAPPLGVVYGKDPDNRDIRRIETFVAGMILTLDKSGFPGEKQGKPDFHRLFAPISPHTTTSAGRSCQSCHQDPNALGYGRGKLRFVRQGTEGKWLFEPAYDTYQEDNLPQDAWIGFLENPKGLNSTRHNARPFNLQEQKNILTAGACLTCHAETSDVMLRSLDNFEQTLQKRSPACAVPVWE